MLFFFSFYTCIQLPTIFYCAQYSRKVTDFIRFFEITCGAFWLHVLCYQFQKGYLCSRLPTLMASKPASIYRLVIAKIIKKL